MAFCCLSVEHSVYWAYNNKQFCGKRRSGP